MGVSDIIIPAATALADAEPAAAAALRAPRVEAATSELLISLIDAGERLRSVDAATVEDLAVSITETTLAHPITVRPLNGRFELVVGAHRLAAFRRLGRRTIPARIQAMTDLEARQLEIDENLVRQGLTALERLTFLGERVEVWAARNPDKVVADASQPIKQRGRPPRNFAKLAKTDAYVPAMMGFVAETARDTGLSSRTVYRSVQALAGLPAPLRDRLQGSWIAKNDAALRGIAAIADPVEQDAAVEVLLAGRTKNVAAARAIAAGATPESEAKKTPSQAVAADFRKLWKAATPSQRDELLTWLAGQALPKGWNVSKSEGAL